jgi:hypothetical protein
VLVTRFLAGASLAEVIDFMPVGRESGGHTEQESRQLVRIAKAIHGPARFQIECRPAFDYGRQRPEVYLDSDRRNALFISPAQQFALKSPYPLELCDGGVTAEFVLKPEEEAVFVYCGIGKDAPITRSTSPERR